jgi:hypothetical protein
MQPIIPATRRLSRLPARGKGVPRPATGKPKPYKAGHAPVIAWRRAAA